MKQNRNVDRKRQIHRNSKSHTRTVAQQSNHPLVPMQTNVNDALSTPMQRNLKNNIKTVTERANVLNNNTAPLPEIVSASNIGAYVNQIDIIRSIINLESITSNISQNFTFIDGGGGSGDKIIINNIWKDDNNEYADKEWVLEQIANIGSGGGGGSVNLSDYIKFGENTSLSTAIIRSPDSANDNLQMNYHTFMLNRANNLNLKLTLNETEREARIFTSNTLYLRAETLKFNTANDSIMFYYDYQTCEMRSNDFTFRTNVDNKELLKINDNTITYKGQPLIGTGGTSIDTSNFITKGDNEIDNNGVRFILNTNSNYMMKLAPNELYYIYNHTIIGGIRIENNTDLMISNSGGRVAALTNEFIITDNINDYVNSAYFKVTPDTIEWNGQSLVNRDLSTYIHGGDNTNIPDITVFRGDRDTMDGEYYLIRPEGLEFYSKYGYFYLYTSSDKNCTWFWNQSHPLEIYFNTVTIASNTGNISLIANSFGDNTRSSINITTTGIVSIFNNEFLLIKNTQNDLSSPYFKVTPDTIEWNGQSIIGTGGGGDGAGGGSVDLTGYIHMGSNVVTTPIRLMTDANESTNENIYITGSSIRYYTGKAVDGQWTIRGHVTDIPSDIPREGTYFNLSAPFMMFSIYKEFIITNYDSSETILRVNNDTITWKGQSLIGTGGSSADLSNYVHFGTNIASDSTADVSISYNNDVISIAPQKLKIEDGLGNHMYIDKKSISVYADSNKSWEIYVNPSNKGMNIETSTLTVESPEVEFHCDTIGIYHGTKVYPTCEITDDSFIIDRATLIMQLGSGKRYLQINDNIFKWGGYAMLHEGINTDINSVKLHATTATTYDKCLELKPDGITITSENNNQANLSVSTLQINCDFSEYDFQLNTKLSTFNLSNNFIINLPNNTATFDTTDFNVKTPSFKVSYDTNDKSTTIFEINNDTVTYKGQSLVNEDLSTYIHSGENRTNDGVIIKDESYDVYLTLNCRNIKLNQGTQTFELYSDESSIYTIDSQGGLKICSEYLNYYTQSNCGLYCTDTICEMRSANFTVKNEGIETLKVTNDTITYKGQPIIGAGTSGSVDLSNYIHGGENTNISDITVYRTSADSANGAYYSISPNGITFHPSYGNSFSTYCNDSMEITSQSKILNIYFSAVNIASASNGNISLISNSFDNNSKYSINLTTTGVVSIFNNEFLLTKNTQNDSSNPYFKVTPDTIEWNGAPIIGTAGGTSSFIKFGDNISNNYVQITNSSSNSIKINSDGVRFNNSDLFGMYVNNEIVDDTLYIRANNEIISINSFKIQSNTEHNPVDYVTIVDDITLKGQSIKIDANNNIKIVDKQNTNTISMIQFINDTDIGVFDSTGVRFYLISETNPNNINGMWIDRGSRENKYLSIRHIDSIYMYTKYFSIMNGTNKYIETDMGKITFNGCSMKIDAINDNIKITNKDDISNIPGIHFTNNANMNADYTNNSIFIKYTTIDDDFIHFGVILDTTDTSIIDALCDQINLSTNPHTGLFDISGSTINIIGRYLTIKIQDAGDNMDSGGILSNLTMSRESGIGITSDKISITGTTNSTFNILNNTFNLSTKNLGISVENDINTFININTNGLSINNNMLTIKNKEISINKPKGNASNIIFAQHPDSLSVKKLGFGFVHYDTDQSVHIYYTEYGTEKIFSVRNFCKFNIYLTSRNDSTFGDDVSDTSSTPTWQFDTTNLYHEGTPYVSKSFTVTHISPIDENYTYDDFTIGLPVYMSGKVYVKNYENKTWKLSTRNDTIDCISSIKPTGVLKEYLGICVSKETDEITFASHGDFLVKVGDSSKYEIGDIIYINDGISISVLDENTPLTAKINKSIIGTVTSIIDSEFVAVFRD